MYNGLMDIAIEDFIIKVPTDYQQMRSLPGDPAGSLSFMKQTSEAACLAMYSGIASAQAMPFNSKDEVVAGIHKALAADQGLIEVQSGITTSGKKYIYSIVKTVNRGSIGVQYSLTLHIGYFAEHVFQTQAFFDETGYTGGRDASVFAILQNEGKITVDGQNISGWMEDPYDPEYKNGILMNMGEKEEYDEAFPNHPLTQARQLAKNLVIMN